MSQYTFLSLAHNRCSVNISDYCLLLKSCVHSNHIDWALTICQLHRFWESKGDFSIVHKEAHGLIKPIHAEQCDKCSDLGIYKIPYSA